MSVHMAKIIECASLCCVPGGRDPILAILDDEGFILESMNPDRRATPISVAAHSLYEQSDPFTVHEPDGSLDLTNAQYVAVDDRRARVSGAAWKDSTDPTIKLEGARWIGERALLLAGSADPRFIAQSKDLLPKVAIVVRDLVCEDTPEDYTLRFRVYGVDGVRMNVPPGEAMPGEVFLMAECIAPTRERASEVVRTCKQFRLHYGYPGRLSTAGNIAFPFTPPEISVGPAYRFTIYHLLHVDDVDALFPVTVETPGSSRRRRGGIGASGDRRHQQDPAVRAAIPTGQPRSDLDQRDDHAQRRLHDLRCAVRARRAHESEAADARRLQYRG